MTKLSKFVFWDVWSELQDTVASQNQNFPEFSRIFQPLQFDQHSLHLLYLQIRNLLLLLSFTSFHLFFIAINSKFSIL